MKKIISVIIFCVIAVHFILAANSLFVDKSLNRYYMLSRELEQYDNIDVQIYGSCHAYTSFDSLYFTQKTGISSYNMSNPSEIIPATYLRMYERFKKDVPEVVFVETWGVNAYETYIEKELIFEKYLPLNIEDIPFSTEKLSVINNYDSLDILEDNFHIAKYKERLLEFSLTEADFDYSFEKAAEIYDPESENWLYQEMDNRFTHNGFKSNPSTELLDYEEQQAQVSEEDSLKVESDLICYVEKIIQLCKDNDVHLIFYRAPYRSSENELKKANYLKDYFEEKEIEFDYKQDFYDYEHLSDSGAKKCTDFLLNEIL